MQEKLVLVHDLIKLRFFYFYLTDLSVLQFFVQVSVAGSVILVLVLVNDKLHQRVVRHFVLLLQRHHAVLVIEDLGIERLQNLRVVFLELRHDLRLFEQLLLLEELFFLFAKLFQTWFLRWQVHFATFDLQFLIFDDEAEQLVHFGFVIGNDGVVLQVHDHELVDVLRLNLMA